MSNFPFVDDKVLQSNLDQAFAHIVDLLALSESFQYKGKALLVSSLRKTIIIHTASIVEALLLWKLKHVCKEDNIELVDEWKYYNIVTIYKVSNSEEAIAGLRKREKKSMDRLDFVRIIDLCQKYKIIKSKKFRDNIDNVRDYRNRLHIGGLLKIDAEYGRKDLEICFNVAQKVKELVSK